ncbi:MAG: nucleotidyl transferase AbiEii/AbiGii toxin family protein [Rhodospirillaceae bacterium]|nr:nucleotidyl transferase AbiEii/AbiGii toxin family protein [Rhodospirillaceae bacterium]
MRRAPAAADEHRQADRRHRASRYPAAVARDLAFKGARSLSKAYRAIHRFSEGIDISDDIRALASDLVAA